MAAALGSPASTVILQTFDKGLRSRSMGDQLATVVNTASLVKQHPFPMFINTIVVRLADAFKEGSNELRMCVARVLAECGSHLSLVFSGREILKRLLSVSHSNDPEARALTLQVIASLAPIFPESKQVHHLIVESMATDNRMEFSSACYALTAFTRLSTDFSATVISQLAEMLISTETSFERKLLLVPVFGGMKATVATTKEVFGLSSRLLETFTQNDLISQLLCAMTALAEATRYTIPEQLTVLIGVFSRSIENVSLSNVALKNIEKLAKHSHIWTDEHLKAFHELKSRIESNELIFIPYLDVLVQLSNRTRPGHIKFFNEILSELGYLCSSNKLRLRIRYLHISCNVYCSLPCETHCNRLFNAFCCSATQEMPRGLAGRLYRTMGRFMCCGSVPDDTVLALLSPILSLPPTHTNMPQFIELFCLITDRLPFAVRILHNWAVQVVAENDNLRSSLLSFLLLSPTIELPNTICTVINGTDFDKYKVARIAFRNGHWASTAKPNLDAINTKVLSNENSRWISVLRELAASELDDFTVDGVQKQTQHLQKANGIMQSLAWGSVFIDSFAFPRGLINCLLLSAIAGQQILRTLSSFLHMTQQFSLRGTHTRIKNALSSCDASVSRASVAWQQLAKASYGADAQSLDFLSQQYTLISIVHYGIQCLVGEKAPISVPIPDVSVSTTSSQQMRTLLSWANVQMTQLLRCEKITEQAFNHFFSILKTLFKHRVCLPRFFFQQFYTTNIQLSISPGSQKENEITVSAVQPVPIQVDGVISTTHKTPVDSLIILAKVHFGTTPANNYTQTRVVKPTEDIYFSTQFLMQFKQSCHIDFSVEFIDGEKMKKWNSGATAILKVIVKE